MTDIQETAWDDALWDGALWDAPAPIVIPPLPPPPLPPLPADDSSKIEVLAAGGGESRWQTALWGTGTWALFEWFDVTPQSMNAIVTWGADDPSGVLTVPAAGSWTIKTYDPERLLDPSNGMSPISQAIRPGRAIRISYKKEAGGTIVVRQGLIDEVEYDLISQQGTLRGTDLVQLLVGAKLLEGQELDLAMPGTLRARAQYLIDKAGLHALVPVAALSDDPIVGTIDSREASVWTHILTAAYDCLYAAWLDPLGTLRFRSFGNPNDYGLQIGGEGGIAIDSMTTQGSLQSVFTHVIAFDQTAPDVMVEGIDLDKVGIYGDILLKRDRPIPNARWWVDSVLADRSGSALQYVPGTMRIQTEEQLQAVIGLGMIDLVSLRVDSVDLPINVSARILGASIEANTESGWSSRIIGYIPAKEWDDAEAPVQPPEPPSIPTRQVVRTYACTADSRLAHSSSLDAGNGLDVNIPIGYISPYRNRAVLDFADIPFGDVISVDKAELLVTTGSNACGAFGSDPKVKAERITGGWSEGTYNVNCGFGTANSVKYPGPGVSSSGAVTASLPKNTGGAKSIDITGIARAWFSGQKQYGVRLVSAGEDTSKYTTSIYARHHGTAAYRPSIRLTVTVPEQMQ